MDTLARLKVEPTISEIKKYVLRNGGSFYKTSCVVSGEEAYCANDINYRIQHLISTYKLSLRMQENLFATKRY